MKIYEFTDGLVLNAEQKRYWEVHKKRYEVLLNIIEELKVDKKQSCRILDIGPSFFTKILIDKYPQYKITALGLSGEISKGGHLPSIDFLKYVEFINFDLNMSYDKSLQPVIEDKFDIVIIAEVIEHLHIAPEYVFRFLKDILGENGHIILQTPNAVSLIKRIQMLFGKNPYEPIRENFENPGHFREYTLREIKTLIEKEEFVIQRSFCKNYFTLIPNNWKSKLYRFLQNILGERFKDGITIVAAK